MRLDVALVAGLTTAAVLAVPSRAAAEPQLETSVSAPQLEVGEPFEIELKAVVTEGDAPERPLLTPPAGVTMKGPRVGTRREMSFVNGTFETKKGITATWTLAAARPGSYVIGPPQVTWGGSRYDGQVVRVEVLPAGSIPTRPTRRGRLGRLRDDPFDFDPFDLLRGPRQPSQDDPFGDLLAQSQGPEEFLVDAAPDPTAFLRATVSPRAAIVGEQVTLRIYAYGSRGGFEEVNTSEASRPKFLSHVIVENSYRQQRYAVDIGGKVFHAVKLREVALFPLEAGKLEIGPMRMGFRGPGYPSAAAHRGLVRHTEPLLVDVAEPPIGGRPPGYRLGDAGHFTLEAAVQPRSVRQGEAVSVALTIDGTGYPPSEVRLPEQRDVEWLTPEVNEQLRLRGSAVGGTRRLSYVVRLEKPGSVDLGEATLPFYDVVARRYETARARIGTVEVAPAQAPAAPAASTAPAEKPAVRISDLASPRKHLGAMARTATPLSDATGFWLLLVAGPLAVLGGAGVVRGAGRLRARRASRGESLAHRAREALDAARARATRGDDAGTTTDVERAVYLAIEEATGLKARGILRERLEPTLRERGQPSDLAKGIVELLDACEAARFARSGRDENPLVQRADGIVRQLLKARTGVA